MLLYIKKDQNEHRVSISTILDFNYLETISEYNDNPSHAHFLHAGCVCLYFRNIK